LVTWIMRTTPREVFISLKANFNLNNVQQAVLIGTLLGDGTIQMRKKDARLHIKHSLNQISLVEYKRKVFANITNMNVRVFKQKVGGVDYNFAEFVTLTHSEFTRFYKLFYKEHKKVVPTDLGQLLKSPMSVAVWIMDDGSSEYAGVSIQTHSFTEEEVKNLIKVIENNFNLKALMRKNKNRWIIYFTKSSLFKLTRLVSKYTLPEFEYKLKPYSLRPRRDCTPGPDTIGI